MTIATVAGRRYYGGTMPKPLSPLTPRHIREIRQQLGLTQAQAAEKIGVARRTWMYWESPTRGQAPSPAAARLIRLLEAGRL